MTAYGPGLLNGVSGEPSQFTISTKGAGAGGLSMAVEGPSKAEVIFFMYCYNVGMNHIVWCGWNVSDTRRWLLIEITLKKVIIFW